MGLLHEERGIGDVSASDLSLISPFPNAPHRSFLQAAWDILQLLPTNKSVLNEIRSLKGSSSQSWHSLLNARSPYSLLYNLHIIDTLIQVRCTSFAPPPLPLPCCTLSFTRACRLTLQKHRHYPLCKAANLMIGLRGAASSFTGAALNT